MDGTPIMRFAFGVTPVPERFRQAASLGTFSGPTLVRCPRCASRAEVVEFAGRPRLSCRACSLSREWDGRLHCLGEDGHAHVYVRSPHTRSWIDESGRSASPTGWFSGQEVSFGVELWLKATCCGGHVLWALNDQHLDWLEGYVSAELRERSPNSPRAPSASHSVLARKLPRWLKSAKHRDEVLRTIGRLRAL